LRMESLPSLKIKNLTLRRVSRIETVEVLKGATADFSSGLNIVYGPAGCGKTTLLESLAGLEKISGGEIIIEGKFFFLTQVPEKEFVYDSCAKEISGSADTDVDYYLKKAGLSTDIKSISPWKLSRGERKRLAVARNLYYYLNDKRGIYLLDDPFTDMDSEGIKVISENIIENGCFKVIMTTNRLYDLKYFEDKEIDFSLYKMSGGVLK